MSKLTNADIYEIGIQDDADSYPLRENFAALKSKINETIDELAAVSIGTTNAETSDARPYDDNLKARLDSDWYGQANYIKNGGICTVSSTGNTVNVTAGQAKVNGIDVKWNASASASVSLTSATSRLDVVVINSDATLSIVVGTESADPVFPDIAITQKPLYYLTVSTTTVSATDCRDQGCWFNDEGRWQYKWKIQQAVSEIITGEIFIGKGIYYEEVDLTGKNNITLRFENGAKIYRISDTNYCIKSVNTSGNETVNIKIIGADLYGNGKAGSVELLKFEYTDESTIINSKFDGNQDSTSLYKDYYLDYCYNIILKNNYYTKYAFDLRNVKNVIFKEVDLSVNPINAIALKKPILKLASEISDIAVGDNPWQLAFAGRYMYVINLNDNDVSVIDTVTQTKVGADIAVGGTSTGIAFDGRYMYVINLADNDVSIIDTTTRTNIGADVAVGSNPRGIAFDGRYMYVCNNGDDNVSVIDTTTQLKVGGDITVGNAPENIAFDGRYMYITNNLDNDVSVIDTTTQLKVGADIAVGSSPIGMAFDGRYMYVVNSSADNDVSIIDTTTRTNIGADIAVGSNPAVIAFDGRYMYVINRSDNDVSIIDTVTQTKVGADIAVGSAPTGIAFDGRYMYVVNSSDDDVSVIRNNII